MYTACSRVLTRLSRTLQDVAILRNPIVIGAMAVALATIIRLCLEPLVHTHGPFLFFAIAVVIAALYGGLWAGIVGMFLSIPVCDYLFIDPRHTWFIHDARGDSIMMALFAALGLLTSGIIHRFHQTSRRLKQLLIDLQQSESKLKMIAATVPEMLFTMTSGGAAEYLNGHFSKYSGRPLSELAGRGWLDLINPDDRTGLNAEICRRFEACKEFETSIRLRGADGIYRWFKWRATPVLDLEGKVKKWFGACSDIDKEKHLTETLESRTQELMRLNEGLERFAYAASHDLQAPLRTIGMMTEFFLHRSGGKIDQQSCEMLASIMDGVERMKRLVRDIMELAKASNTANEPSAPVDTYAVAEFAISNLRQAVEESGATIAVEQLPRVFANESAILRLFQNLIANAIKYRGEDAPHVYISASPEESEWVFSVKDKGIGIDRQYHDKIFEPFRRLHGQSEYEGSGLGLSACLRIVQSLHGRIWVESKLGEGSTFFFTIPMHIDCDNERETSAVRKAQQ